MRNIQLKLVLLKLTQKDNFVLLKSNKVDDLIAAQNMKAASILKLVRYPVRKFANPAVKISEETYEQTISVLQRDGGLKVSAFTCYFQ